MEMTVALEKGHLPDQILLVTSVSKRAISRKTEGQRDLASVVIDGNYRVVTLFSPW